MTHDEWVDCIEMADQNVVILRDAFRAMVEALQGKN